MYSLRWNFLVVPFLNNTPVPPQLIWTSFPLSSYVVKEPRFLHFPEEPSEAFFNASLRFKNPCRISEDPLFWRPCFPPLWFEETPLAPRFLINTCPFPLFLFSLKGSSFQSRHPSPYCQSRIVMISVFPPPQNSDQLPQVRSPLFRISQAPSFSFLAILDRIVSRPPPPPPPPPPPSKSV